MVAEKINARDLILQVQLADLSWQGIAGLNSIVPNPSENEETVDTTVYASAGDYEGEIMQRGASMALEGFVYLDNVSGAQDVGQARCETLATLKAYESLGSIRFRHPLNTTLWKVWLQATFSVGEQGGGNNDKTPWKCAITRSGPSTTMAVA